MGRHGDNTHELVYTATARLAERRRHPGAVVRREAKLIKRERHAERTTIDLHDNGNNHHWPWAPFTTRGTCTAPSSPVRNRQASVRGR